MIGTKLYFQRFILISFLFTISTTFVAGTAGRCYLCSQSTLAECARGVQPDSALYTQVFQYYTEPCNGQCILFRNANRSVSRGCSWSYGHMRSKSVGWHELSPGIQAYFCDTYLCNNGTYEPAETTILRPTLIENAFVIPSAQTISPQQLFIMAENAPAIIHTDQHLSSIDTVPRQLRQCYSCTARLTGCGEFLDPRYVSKYIHPCASSCIIFRNPNDHDLITRDCSTSWPGVTAKSGLHKLLGSDAFFCQESLCNGISFDFIMGIFHNQLPAVIKFPPVYETEDASTIVIPATSTVIPISITTTVVYDDDSDVVWEDPDLDFVLAEPVTAAASLVASTIAPFPTELFDDDDVVYESSTVSLDPIEHFDFIEQIPPSSTLKGGLAVAEDDGQFNWWDLSESSFPPITPSTKPTSTETSTVIPSTIKLTHIEEDEWAIFSSGSTPSDTELENLPDPNSEIDLDMNDYFLPTLSSTPASNNVTPPFVPYYFNDYKPNGQLLNLIKPMTTLAMPPFSWMLNLLNQNKSQPQGRRSFIIRNLTTTRPTRHTKRKLQLKTTTKTDFKPFHDYCHKKGCQNGGRLNADCVCICLPAFTGNNCEIMHCHQEPAHICDSVLQHECRSDYVRYLCPKFCRMKGCSSQKLS